MLSLHIEKYLKCQWHFYTLFAEPIPESKGMHVMFPKKGKKMLKKGKKGQNIWKLGQKCANFEYILKKGRWLHVIIARNKLLEKSLICAMQTRFSYGKRQQT